MISLSITKTGGVVLHRVKRMRSSGGTSLQGYIDISYRDLVAVFGVPNDVGDDYKSDAEWSIKTPDGIATIYNYKDGQNYLGDEGSPVQMITDWHIGGKDDRVVEWIGKAVKVWDEQIKFELRKGW